MGERSSSLRYHSAMIVQLSELCFRPDKTDVAACRVACLLISLLLLQACQPTATVRDAPPALAPELQSRSDQASAMLASGEPGLAAEAYASLAQNDPARRSRWRLLQADALYQTGQYRRSSNLLRLLDSSGLDTEDLALQNLLQAENAIALIDHERLQELDAQFRQSRLQLAARYQPRAQAVLDLLQKAIGSCLQLALSLLQQASSDELLREAAFARLAETGFEQLADYFNANASDEEAGWLAAAASARRTAVEQHFQLHWAGPQQQPIQALLGAARSAEQQAFADLYVASLALPQRIAVILPQSGRLESAAEAVRMGIISAWSGLPPSARPALYFIDASQGMTAAYYEALDAGSDLLLGPLSADQVSILRDLPDRTIPMLALNLPGAGGGSTADDIADDKSADDELAQALEPASSAQPASAQPGPALSSQLQPPPALANSHYFALPPQDSAIAAARWMHALSHGNVVALGADDNSGQRLLQAFTTTFEQLNGTVLRQAQFDPTAVEFTALLDTVLGLQNSQQRHRQLQDLLGLELGFQARADDNIDALFIAANQRQSRLLLPQLKFVDADYLPVFLSERSYAANGDSAYDRDLERAHITMPGWLLGAPPQPSLQQVRQWYPPAGNEIIARLFGLGHDSLLLCAHINRLHGDTSLRLQAASGALYIDRDGVVRRELQRARYRNGDLALLP